MTFDELRERGILDKRPAALGAKFGGECEPELEAAYRRLWLGMEIVSWPNPPGIMGWFLKKIGRLTAPNIPFKPNHFSLFRSTSERALRSSG